MYSYYEGILRTIEPQQHYVQCKMYGCYECQNLSISKVCNGSTPTHYKKPHQH